MAHQGFFCARATSFVFFGKTNPVGGPVRWGCDWKGIGFRLPVDREGSEVRRVEVDGCEREWVSHQASPVKNGQSGHSRHGFLSKPTSSYLRTIGPRAR